MSNVHMTTSKANRCCPNAYHAWVPEWPGAILMVMAMMTFISVALPVMQENSIATIRIVSYTK